jgi:hypothetical protein
MPPPEMDLSPAPRNSLPSVDNEKQDATSEKPARESTGDALHRVDGQENAPPPLPFSKARCIALVATVSGASFVNASFLPSFKLDEC